ncbi:hypothetical protein PEPS_17490 [Persicobacter psychrovividus]|uniref:Carboxypeptidase-like regulatory domain-containing protein n=1 Tax=Persicobacter psychrovividus TaxID=387638 RepID=A0ABM7VEY8_9BACT|nr:hypothetical protein PEPS_17490 [Persicobacter psychrovividus]
MRKVHQRCFLTVILNILFFVQVFAQNSIVLRGQVVDDQTNAPIPFATLEVLGTSVGTVANEEGFFRFSVDQQIGDSLGIHSVGYQYKFIEIPPAYDNDKLMIHLSAQTKMLSEVVVGDMKITPRRILQKSARNIRKNYPTKPYVLNGYYRDYLKRKKGGYICFLESAVDMIDPGFQKTQNKIKLNLEQLRLSDSYLKNYHEFVKADQHDTTKVLLHGVLPSLKGNEFASMLFHDPLRNHFESVPFIGSFEDLWESSYHFELDYYTYIGEDEVYVISIQPNPKLNYWHVDVEGQLFIRVKDYAVMKINYNYFVTKKLERKKWYELNLEYTDQGGKLYLKYLSYMNYFKIFNGRETAEISQYREFFVNSVVPGKPDLTQMKGELVDLSKPMFEQKVPDIPNYWDDYNYLLLGQPLME